MDVKSRAPLFIFLVAIGLGAGFILFSALSSEPVKTAPPLSAELPAPTLREYGLSLDSFEVNSNTVDRHEFLATILKRYQIDASQIASLTEKAKPVFDVRKIATGNSYSVFTSKEGKDGPASYLVYQPNPVDYVVFDLRDSMRVYTGKHPVIKRMKTVAGVINGSLYETFGAGGANPALSMQFAKIYGWAINFYALRDGDWFKVQYEQSYVKGEPVGMGRITMSLFSHQGKEYQAYYFKPDNSSEEGAYYDEEGHSLRRAFLKAPLKYDRITSRYSLRRFHPVQRRWKAHLGTDFAAPTGTPIVATGSGKVIESRYSRYNGHYVKIRHNQTYSTQYLHMSRRAVRSGQQVQQGEVIGYVGSTGLATGPHVCYRFWKNGRQVDALAQDFPPAEPVPDSLRGVFSEMVASGRRTLAAIPLESNEKADQELARR